MMLAESEKMSIYTKTANIYWENEEWDLVAAELKRQNPRRETNSFPKLDFTSLEVEDAAEMVLEQDRQRAYDNFNIIRGPLFDAFQRLKISRPVPAKIPEGIIDKGGRVHWSAEEYQAIIDRLYRMNPAYVNDGFKLVNKVVINKAMEIFEPHRRRSFTQVVSLHEKLQQYFLLRPPVVSNGPKLVKKEFTTGVITEPPIKKSDGYHAVATALHEAFQAPVVAKQEPKKRKPYVSWSPADWVLLAREMRRQNPHINFFASKFSTIDLPALREAQRAAFPLEHRKSISNSLGLQGPLVDAFKALRIELDKEREEEDWAKLAEKTPAVVEVAPVEVVAEVVPEPVIEVAKIVPPKPTFQVGQVGDTHFVMTHEVHTEPEVDFIAAITNAAVPLMSLLISEITKNVTSALLPKLTLAITSALEGIKTPPVPVYGTAAPVAPPVPEVVAMAPVIVPAPVIAPVVDEVRPRLTAAEIAAFNGVVPKPKKPKIAMLGPMGKQITDIEQAYPQYEFVFIQNGHGIKEAALSCELFLAYTSHMNSHRKNDVHKYVPHAKLRRIDGSLSAVKHQISVWEKTKDD